MKNKRAILCSSFFFLLGCDLIAPSKSEDKGIQHGSHTHKDIKSYYTCSMHPNVKQDEPGKCPICYMNLTKVEVEEAGEMSMATTKPKKTLWQCKDFPDVTSEQEDVCPMDGTPMIKMSSDDASKVVAKLKLRKAQLSHFRPTYFPVTQMKMTKKIRLLGSVLQSEERESSIPARIAGRVEKVYVKSTGSKVNKGDPVIDLFSPKLITAGEEYLLSRKNYLNNKSKGFEDLLKRSEERLRQWGIARSQYESWYRKGSIPRAITIYSPSSGIVRKRNAIIGKYFKEGQNLFELSDLSDVWVEMDVYEHDASLVKMGQNVSLEFTSLPGEKLEGQIDFINPVIDTSSRTLKIRTTIVNQGGKLMPGMVADAVLNVEFEGLRTVVPRSSIIDTGKRKIVWVKVDDSTFQAKTIFTGLESEGYVEIKKGLQEDEQIVADGNFLLDAQAQLFGGYEDFGG